MHDRYGYPKPRIIRHFNRLKGSFYWGVEAMPSPRGWAKNIPSEILQEWRKASAFAAGLNKGVKS